VGMPLLSASEYIHTGVRLPLWVRLYSLPGAGATCSELIHSDRRAVADANSCLEAERFGDQNDMYAASRFFVVQHFVVNTAVSAIRL
jgi:hypothetical protein